MASFVKISITDEVAKALEQAKRRYPTMSDSELFRLGLAELSYKAELERRKAWVDSLPILELSEEEQDELDAALKAADEEPGEIMSLDELKHHLKEAVSEDVVS